MYLLFQVEIDRFSLPPLYCTLHVLFQRFVLYFLIISLIFFSDETAKWEKITYLGIVSCSALAIYNLSKGHPHTEEPPVSFCFYTSAVLYDCCSVFCVCLSFPHLQCMFKYILYY